MMFSRISIVCAAAVAVVVLAPTAQARHHGYRHHHGHALKVRPLPAHQRPDWVGLAGVPVPGLVDLGLGPVFPFGGWPK